MNDYPLNFVEVVWGDGKKTDRGSSTTDLPAFGKKRFQIPGRGRQVAGSRPGRGDQGAFVQPIKLAARRRRHPDNTEEGRAGSSPSRSRSHRVRCPLRTPIRSRAVYYKAAPASRQAWPKTRWSHRKATTAPMRLRFGIERARRRLNWPFGARAPRGPRWPPT
jgi:hypothetical protein